MPEKESKTKEKRLKKTTQYLSIHENFIQDYVQIVESHEQSDEAWCENHANDKSLDFSKKIQSFKESKEESDKEIVVFSFRGVLENYHYRGLGRLLEELVSRESVSTIIFGIASPGGDAQGASELSEKIRGLSQTKRIIAYVDPYAYSAGLEIIAGATEIIASPDAMVGSIGTYVIHADVSQALENFGVKVSIIKAGEKKIDANMFEPLSERARGDLQTIVDTYYGKFVSAVALGRGVSEEIVKKDFGQGGVLFAKEALRVGLIDGILSFEQLVERETALVNSANQLIQAKSFLEREKQKLILENLK